MARVEDWPGISLVKSVLSGEPVRGTWFNRTAEHRARLRGEDFDPRRYATEETVVLSQLPCWRHLSPEKYRAYGLFLAAFREAAERLKAGDRSASFPTGCFPPGLPFVAA